MYIVYILRSEKNPKRHYVGITQNLEARLTEHNGHSTGYTRKYAPWFIETFTVFRNRARAIHFEKYLKRGSGHTFLRKHLI